MIHDQSSLTQWRHVDSASSSNPADDISRGMTAQQLVDCDRWFNRPPFLLEEDAWSAQPDFSSLQSIQLREDAEVKKEPQVYATDINTTSMTNPIDNLIATHRRMH